MAVSDPNKFASVGNVKALFETGEGFVREANIAPGSALVPLTGSTGQVLTSTGSGVEWGAIEPKLLWEGSAQSGSITVPGISGYRLIALFVGGTVNYAFQEGWIFLMTDPTDEGNLIGCAILEEDGYYKKFAEAGFGASISGDVISGVIDGNSKNFVYLYDSGEGYAAIKKIYGVI